MSETRKIVVLLTDDDLVNLASAIDDAQVVAGKDIELADSLEATWVKIHRAWEVSRKPQVTINYLPKV